MRYRGFTLLELLLVISIISTLAYLAIVPFSTSKLRIDKKSITDTIIQHISYSQEIALTEKRFTFLVCNREDLSYKLLKWNNSVGNYENIPLWSDYSFNDNINLFGKVNSLQFGPLDTISFNPWGLLDQSDNIILTVDDKTITVRGITGYVSY